MSCQTQSVSQSVEMVDIQLRVPRNIFEALRGAAALGEARTGERISAHIMMRILLEDGLERAAGICGKTVEDFERIGKEASRR